MEIIYKFQIDFDFCLSNRFESKTDSWFCSYLIWFHWIQTPFSHLRLHSISLSFSKATNKETNERTNRQKSALSHEYASYFFFLFYSIASNYNFTINSILQEKKNTQSNFWNRKEKERKQKKNKMQSKSINSHVYWHISLRCFYYNCILFIYFFDQAG